MKLSDRLALLYIRTKFKVLSSLSKKKAAEVAFELFCTTRQRNKKPLSKVFYSGEKINFKIGDLTVQGWRWNHPSGRKVLVLHGFESTVVNFEKYIQQFIAKGYEVLAFDAPAHGRSEGKQISAPLYKKTILEIYRRYGPVQSFLAHSFGGLAVCLALEEIPHNNDYRLALIAPATETTTAIDIYFHFLKLDPRVRPEFDKLIIRRGGVGPAWYSISRAMNQISASVLWVHDEEDEITPLRDAREVQSQNHPNITFEITKGLGHRRIYRDKRVMGLVVDFL